VGALGRFVVSETYVGGSVVDPLDMYVVTSFTKVVVYECEDVIGMHFVNTANMHLIPLRFGIWIFCVDGGNDVRGLWHSRARRHK
jgi:hypothetical protein